MADGARVPHPGPCRGCRCDDPAGEHHRYGVRTCCPECDHRPPVELEAARLWSLACAVQQHDGCGGVFERDGIRVVCPCSCHGVLVDAGPVDVRSLCLRYVEVLAGDDGPRARYSCECGGDGCPLDPRAATGG